MALRKKQWKTAALFAAAAGVLTLLAGLGVLYRPDLTVCDALYQRPRARDGNIVLVELDARALEELGPYGQWGRGVMARALEALNRSEDCRPAVIGVDTVYSGESDPQQDAQLAQAAARYGNVVVGCVGQLGGTLVERDGDYYLDDFAVSAVDEPYAALRGAAAQGHINAMLDSDGILRHHMLFLSLQDGTRIPSLALAVAERYRAAAQEGPLTLPQTTARGFWYLPFCGRPGAFSESISIVDVLSGAVPAEYFAGKIVLIGPCAPGLQDSYLTAADHGRPMYGVEYNANAVQALLWGEYPREAPERWQLAALFAVLLGAMAGFWRQSVRRATALWAALCAGWVLLCYALCAMGWLLHVLWVPVGVTILYIGCIAANYLQAALERRRVTNTFKRYVAPEIVTQLLENRDALQLGGRAVEIAVLFVDIRGFTTLSEKLAPEQVVRILNRYLTYIAQCILNNGGTLDKFVGDEAMAFWGAPLEQEDYVMRAARAALEMTAGAQKLSQELEAEFGCAVSYGVGIHLGKAVVGNVGCPQRMDYTAIGDTVNTAARLQANAPAGVIYISRAVADALQGRIRATPLAETIALKGKKAPVEILTLDGLV